MPQDPGPWRLETGIAILPWDLDSINHLGVFLNEEGWVLFHKGIGSRGYAALPMAGRGVFAVGGWPRKLVVADNREGLLHAFDLADPTLPSMVIPIRMVRRPPTEDELSVAQEIVFRTYPHWRGHPEYLEIPKPDLIPNLGDLLVDQLGRVWVGSYQADPSAARVYHAYDTRDQSFVARTAMPAGIEVLEIGADYVLGITRDALGIERIALLDLHSR